MDRELEHTFRELETRLVSISEDEEYLRAVQGAFEALYYLASFPPKDAE